MATINYAFTLRRTSSPADVTENIYREHIIKMLGKGLIIDSYVFERKNGLHVHGIINVPSNYNLQRLRVRGWKLHLDPIYNYTGWSKYIAKEQFKNDTDQVYIEKFQSQRRLPYLSSANEI